MPKPVAEAGVLSHSYSPANPDPAVIIVPTSAMVAILPTPPARPRRHADGPGARVVADGREVRR